jgi:protein required for attachment to host cells
MVDGFQPDFTAMKPDWTVIANATRARLLQQEQGAPMVILESFIHPEGRGKVSELADDKAGQQKTDRFGGAAYEPRVNAKRKEHTEFARELAHLLEQEAQLDHFRSLTIFASSPFLGELKAELGKATLRRLISTHEQDLTSLGLSELEERIAHELALHGAMIH